MMARCSKCGKYHPKGSTPHRYRRRRGRNVDTTKRRRTATGDTEWELTAEQRDRIYKRDGRKCGYCGTLVGPFQIDHIWPLWQDGRGRPQNLTVACKPCNQTKGASTDPVWWRQLMEHGAEKPRREAERLLKREAHMTTRVREKEGQGAQG